MTSPPYPPGASSASGAPTSPDLTRRPVAVVAGATGLVGGHCADQLARSGRFGDVVALVRRPPPSQPPGIRWAVVDFATDFAPSGSAGANGRAQFGLAAGAVTAALCALGTTIKKAGSKLAFRAIDHDAVLAFATWAKRNGATRFVLVSSVGASPTSSNFYLRVKGETEADVSQLGFPRLVILRPSFLRGKRQEARTGEAIAGKLVRFVDPLLAGSLRRYRSIDASQVAAAMIAAASNDQSGRFIWEHDEIARQETIS